MTNVSDQEGIKTLSVLCLTTSFPKSPDDPAGFFVYQLTEALVKKDVRIAVLSPEGNQAAEEWQLPYKVYRFHYAPRRWQVLAQRPGGVPVALKLSWKNYLLVPPFLISFLWNILRLARESDLILANWAFCGVLARFSSPLHHKPIVTVLRGSDVKIGGGDWRSSLFLNTALKGSKLVVCVGKELETWLRKTADYPEKIYHIPNGIYERFFSIDFPKISPTINILFIGSLIPRKGVDILLKAIKNIAHLRLHLFIVGQGPLEQELKELASELKIAHLVTFQGKISPGRPMAEMMARAHFLVLPSHHEGRPNVILEAMAAGRPVIGSDIDGVRELVQHSKTGYLFADGDIKALSQVIEKLVKNPDKFSEMGRAARKWLSGQGLSWENTAKEYVNILKRYKVS